MSDAEKPLVTFALFAYNQEKYIREAVEGAFSQTYEPLEIILSDDCSSDRTFEIMREMAAGYEGPHRIVLRRSEINLGTAAHVQAVSRAMNGDLLVVAAGDDISLSDRTKKMVDAWVLGGQSSSVIHGKMIEIDSETKKIIREVNFRPGCDSSLGMDWYVKNKALPFFSPTCAYSSNVFKGYPDIIGGSVIEDGVLVQRCFMEGGVTPLDEVLIYQRVGHESSGRGFSFESPSRWNRHVRSRIICSINRVNDLNSRKDIDLHVKKDLERYDLNIVYNLSSFLLPATSKMSLLSRVFFSIKIMWRYPSTSSFLGRAYFALRFSRLIPSLTVNG